MESLFIRLGLKPKEATAFLELVRLGASPVSIWAKHTQINRSSMYVVLDRLTKSGLVTSFTHKGVQHVQAIPVAELSTILTDKQKFLASTREMLEKSFPELQKLEKTS